MSNDVSKRARIKVNAFSADQMRTFATGLAVDVRARIMRGETVHDQAAPPLKPRYAKLKNRKHPPAIRNLSFSGATLKALGVTSATANKATVGFTDSRASRIVAINARRSLQFGASARDLQGLQRAIEKTQFVKITSGTV